MRLLDRHLGNIDLRFKVGVDTAELVRRDADNGESVTINVDYVTDYVGGATKIALPFPYS
jgi:hypothetical protein